MKYCVVMTFAIDCNAGCHDQKQAKSSAAGNDQEQANQALLATRSSDHDVNWQA